MAISSNLKKGLGGSLVTFQKTLSESMEILSGTHRERDRESDGALCTLQWGCDTILFMCSQEVLGTAELRAVISLTRGGRLWHKMMSHEAFLAVNNITPRSLEREKEREREREGLYVYWSVFCVSILLPLKWSVIPSLLTS
jgi:hypothetical protein